jgi:N-acetylmuramoyl-L-alanine amidase
MEGMTQAIADPLLRALSPINLLTTLLYGECRGESIEGQSAVANVVNNRLATGRWGTTLQQVILSPAQFSCLWPNGGEQLVVLEFANRCFDLARYSRVEMQLRLIAEGLLRPALLDPTNGSTHYYDKRIAAPTWAAAPAIKQAEIGHHLFFSGVK